MATVSDYVMGVVAGGANAVALLFKRGSTTTGDIQIICVATAYDANDNPTAFDPARDATLTSGSAKALTSTRAATATGTEITVTNASGLISAASATVQYRNITNRGTTTAWIGTATPAVAGLNQNTIQLQAGESRDINTVQALYAITASGTTTLDIWTEVQ